MLRALRAPSKSTARQMSPTEHGSFLEMKNTVSCPMSNPYRNMRSLPLDDLLFAAKQRKAVPHEFVLEAIAALSPQTRPLFGCLAVYVEDKIVLILRDKRDQTADNGVWLATTEEHHESLRREFPNMRSIQVLGKKVTGWQVIPIDAPDFEEAALRACELVVARDPRIGKVPGTRRTSGSAAKNATKSKPTTKNTAKRREVVLRSYTGRHTL